MSFSQLVKDAFFPTSNQERILAEKKLLEAKKKNPQQFL